MEIFSYVKSEDNINEIKIWKDLELKPEEFDKALSYLQILNLKNA